MNDLNSMITPILNGSPQEWIVSECAFMSGRLGGLLRNLFEKEPEVVSGAVAYLEYTYQRVYGDNPLDLQQESIRDRLEQDGAAYIYRLSSLYELSNYELELLILTGMAEQHEAFADIFHTLHPHKQPRPTVGLAAQLFCQDEQSRYQFRHVLETGNLYSNGIIQLQGEGPFFTKSIVISQELWASLQGIDSWPKTVNRIVVEPVNAGLEQWLKSDDVLRAEGVLKADQSCNMLITSANHNTAMQRAVALVNHCQMNYEVFQLNDDVDGTVIQDIYRHCLIRDVVPILQIKEGRQEIQQQLKLNNYPHTIIICIQQGHGIETGSRAIINLNINKLSAPELREMWRQTIPELADQASTLAARYPMEPSQAQQIANDLQLDASISQQIGIADVANSIRARSATKINNSVQLIKPTATWQHLVLPDTHILQLKEAVDRLYLQYKVLDEWRFLEGRRGARGIRMMFSGPPGTGKTLSAEVMANSLDVDLLMIDLSRVVSKWIGETEKNLAEIFDIAEETKAVLLFDEADALFGKRTEISDSHDRYANLETSYLLSRLERYEGLAILSTNLQNNIDTAFLRRLEFIVEYQEPDRDQRLALWQCHLPDGVQLAADVNLKELASHYQVVGGLIRNAAVAAAFLAAADGGVLKREHFTRALRREYDKSGKVYRSLPGEIMKTVTGGN